LDHFLFRKIPHSSVEQPFKILTRVNIITSSSYRYNVLLLRLFFFLLSYLPPYFIYILDKSSFSDPFILPHPFAVGGPDGAGAGAGADAGAGF